MEVPTSSSSSSKRTGQQQQQQSSQSRSGESSSSSSAEAHPPTHTTKKLPLHLRNKLLFWHSPRMPMKKPNSNNRHNQKMLLRRRGLCNKFFVEDDLDEATMAEYFSREDCSESSSSSNSDPEPCASSSTSSAARIQGGSTSTSGHKRPLPSILKRSSSIGVEDEEPLKNARQSTAHQSWVSRNYHHKSSTISCSSAGSKSVQFSHVIESHHECILGDHPSVEEGPPLTLAWKALFHETIPLPQPKEQEPHRRPKSKAKKSTKRSSSSRRPQCTASTLSAPCHTQESGSASTGEAVRRWTACERRAIVVEAAQTGGEPFGPPKRSIHSCMARIQKENRKIQKSRGMALQEYMLERDLEELERQLGRCPDGPEAGLVSLLK